MQSLKNVAQNQMLEAEDGEALCKTCITTFSSLTPRHYISHMLQVIKLCFLKHRPKYLLTMYLDSPSKFK
jgi:hypothetical protein